MLVLCAVELPGSAAQSNLADQNIRIAIRHERHKLDFILRVNIYLLLLKTELLLLKRIIRSSVVARNTATCDCVQRRSRFCHKSSNAFPILEYGSPYLK